MSSVVARAQSVASTAQGWAERIPGAGAILESLKNEQRAGAPLLAGGLAYRLFFWVVSLGLLLAAAASFWVRSNPNDVESSAKSFGLAGVAANSATSAVQSGSHARWYFLGAGALLLAYFGIGAVRAMHITSVLAWRLDPVKVRNPLKKSATFSVIVIAVIAIGMGAQWLRHQSPGPGFGAIVLDGGAAFLAAVAAFNWLPHRPTRSPWAMWPGALEVAAGLLLIQVAVTYYLAPKLERSPKLYGTLGAATVVLVWLFLLGRLVVAGIFLNATVEARSARADPHHAHD